MIPDTVYELIRYTLGEGWTLHLPRNGWAETAYVAERAGHRVFIKTRVLLPILRRLAELEIIPPVVAMGEFGKMSFVIQEFVEAPYPPRSWFTDRLGDLAILTRTYHQDNALHAVLDTRKLTYLAEEFDWTDQSYRAVNEAYGAHAPIHAAYRRLVDQLPEVQGVPVAPTHGDLSRKNFLPTRDRIYLVDWDEISLSDPVRDLGPLLWWYLPVSRWPEFLHAYGSPFDSGVFARVYWWAARTSLEVTHGLLQHGYWQRATDFLIDFLAAVNREENPHPKPDAGSP